MLDKLQKLLYIDEAFAEAKKGLGHTRPNPPVGAVIVKNGEIIGRGHHKKAGGDHAEVAAIKNAKRKGHDLKGASIFVTLEPCSKPGRVGACTDAIKSSGITEVYYGCEDPNPVNRGKAKAALKGFASVEFVKDEHCENLIRAFKKHVTTGIPYVTVKMAMTLDGKTVDDFGSSNWITGDKMRKERVGILRDQVDVIMVGAETVRKDNPRLLSYSKKGNPDLVRCVISKSGKLPKDAKVFTEGENLTLVYSDPIAALKDLGARGYMHVLCEGGMKLATYLALEGYVDEWISCIAPKVVGSGHLADAAIIPSFQVLADHSVRCFSLPR